MYFVEFRAALRGKCRNLRTTYSAGVADMGRRTKQKENEGSYDCPQSGQIGIHFRFLGLPLSVSVLSGGSHDHSFLSACTTKRFPSPRCASAIQIVRPLESIAETPSDIRSRGYSTVVCKESQSGLKSSSSNAAFRQFKSISNASFK